jgi:hypothetical protein
VDDLDDKRALWLLMRTRYEMERARDMSLHAAQDVVKEEATGFTLKTLSPVNLFRTMFGTPDQGGMENLPPGMVGQHSVDVDDVPRLPPIQTLPPLLLNGHGEPAETTVTVEPPVKDEHELLRPITPDSETRFLLEHDNQAMTVYLGAASKPHTLHLYQCQVHLLLAVLIPHNPTADVEGVRAALATSLRPPLESIAEQVAAERLWITHVRNERLDPFRFVHVDCKTLRIQTTLKRRRPKAEAAAALIKFMSDFDARKDARDLCARLSECGFWVIARRDDKRQVFLIVERKDATLVQAEGTLYIPLDLCRRVSTLLQR